MDETHPTIAWYHRSRATETLPSEGPPLDSAWLKTVACDAGADDVGFVEMARPEMAGQLPAVQTMLPGTVTLMSIVCRVHRQNTRSPLRSLYNLEQKCEGELLEQSARAVASTLERLGVRAVYLPTAFPMDFDSPLRISHKTVAVAAGLGAMGLNRLVLHPVHGSCITLTTVLLDRAVTSYGRLLSYNPCIDCKLCAAACPTGAVCADGHFNFLACLSHNYRYRLGGFQDWVETLVSARTVEKYRASVSDMDTLNMWQGLTYQASNRCGYCVAVCPAGERAIGEYLADRQQYIADVLTPLREKSETIYALAGSDADGYAEKHFPRKTTHHVRGGTHLTSAKRMFGMLSIIFQREHAAGLNAIYHITLTGREAMQTTVIIKEKTITVTPQLEGHADVTVMTDSDVWLNIISRKTHPLRAILTGKLKITGPLTLFRRFFSCFAG